MHASKLFLTMQLKTLHTGKCDEALDIQSIMYLQHLAARDIVIQLQNTDGSSPCMRTARY